MGLGSSCHNFVIGGLSLWPLSITSFFCCVCLCCSCNKVYMLIECRRTCTSHVSIQMYMCMFFSCSWFTVDVWMPWLYMMCIEILTSVPSEKTLGSWFSGICKNAVIDNCTRELCTSWPWVLVVNVQIQTYFYVGDSNWDCVADAFICINRTINLNICRSQVNRSRMDLTPTI